MEQLLEQVVAKEDMIKVRLYFFTKDPKQKSSFTLRDEFQSKGPFLEDICVLLPREKVFDMIEAYYDHFEFLKDNGYVSLTSQLSDYKIIEEDDSMLGLVLE